MRVTGPGDFFFKPFFVEESLGTRRWLQKAKEGDKGLTRPPASARVSQHKNEVRSMFGLYGWIWFVTVTIVCMTHCTCFVSVCTVKCT